MFWVSVKKPCNLLGTLEKYEEVSNRIRLLLPIIEKGYWRETVNRKHKQARNGLYATP